MPYLKDFLETLSQSTTASIRNKIHDCNEYFKKNFNKSILEVSAKEVLVFLKEIDKRSIKKKTKRKWRYNLASYFTYVQGYKKDIENKPFIIPLPSRRTFDFSGTMHSLEDFEEEEHLLSIEIIKKVIEYIYHTRPTRIFIAIILIIFSGARISEVLHLKLKNLNINQRWFSTIVKSRKTDKREGIYFFPEFIKEYLLDYIRGLRLEHENPTYLFQSNESFIRPKIIGEHLRETRKALGLKAKTNPHAYRDFLNTRRYELGCRPPFLEFLLNQTAKGVNPSSYMKKYKYRIKLRNIYDKYNPFSEDILPKIRL